MAKICLRNPGAAARNRYWILVLVVLATIVPNRITALPPVDKSQLDYVDPEPLTRPLDGVAQLTALKMAYPDHIDRLEYRNGDWAIRVNGNWIYWANGRLLPRKARLAWHRFTRYPFYPYRSGPLEVHELNPEEEARLREILQQRVETPPQRHNAFPGALYGFRTGSAADQAMVTVTFLGRRIRVHPMIREPLQLVQEELDTARHDDARIETFLRDLHRVEAFFWRPIAGTYTVSYHGYGVAVDLLPRSYYRRSAYWRWSAQAGIEEWWNIPEERRWTIPMPIVQIFERHGFVWGGRWLFFDAIHFEYRPELFLLDRFGVTDDSTVSPTGE